MTEKDVNVDNDNTLPYLIKQYDEDGEKMDEYVDDDNDSDSDVDDVDNADNVNDDIDNDNNKTTIHKSNARRRYPGLYMCNKCDKRFDTKVQFITHLKRKIPCDEVRDNNWLLRREISLYEARLAKYKNNKSGMDTKTALNQYQTLSNKLDLLEKILHNEGKDILRKTRMELEELK